MVQQSIYETPNGRYEQFNSTEVGAPGGVTASTAIPTQAETTIKSAQTKPFETRKVSSGGRVRIRPRHWRRQDISRFMKRLNAKLPWYRAMCLGEHLKASDMVCVRKEGRWIWGRAYAFFKSGVGMPIKDCPWIAARSTDVSAIGMTETGRDFALIEYHLEEISQLLAKIGARHKKNSGESEPKPSAE